LSDNISIAGIEKAVSALGYRNSRSLKYRLIYAIKQFYDSDESLRTIRAIDPDEMIPLVWDNVTDNTQLKSKRKNLNSIRSSVNSDLMQLFRDGKNSEGIIIDPSNAFNMCDGAKEAFLRSLSNAMSSLGPITLDSISDVSRLFSEFIEKMSEDTVKALLDKLAENAGYTLTAKTSDDLEVDEDDLEEVDDSELADEEIEDPEGDSDVVEVMDVIIEDEGGAETEEDSDPEDEEDPSEIYDLEEVDEDELDESEEAEEVDGEDLEEVDDSELADDDIEEIEEEVVADIEGAYDIDDDEFDLEDLPENEKKRILAERFDRNLGAMERHFNQFLLISKGTYTIGSKYPKPGDLPEQQIQLNDFYMGKFPVINALFEVFVERTGYTTTAEKKGFGVVYQGRFQKIKDERSGQYRFAWNATHNWKEVKGAYWYQPTGPGSTLHRKRNHPVVQVSYFDAMAFASWVGKRLPTEAEWEATARTDSGYRFPWGDDWRNELCNIETSEIADTTPVDHFSDAINKMGIADLLGNTLEWTSEKCDSETGSRNTFDFHIAKGGSWISEENVPLASRFRFPTDFTSNTLGFRCLAD